MEPSILVMLVEGEAVIRMHLEEELTDARLDRLIATTGEQATAELDADATRYRGVLTDIRLGAGLDGREVARHARELVEMRWSM